MTNEKLAKGTDLAQKIRTVEAELLQIEGLLKNARETPIYEDSPSTKLSMEIKPLGWTGPKITNFSFQFVEKVLAEYKAGLELELSLYKTAFEDL